MSLRIRQLRQSLSPEEQIQLARAIYSNPYFAARLLPKIAATSVRDFDRRASAVSINVESDLTWGAAACIARGSILRSYVEQRVEFEDALMSGHLDRAEQILTQLDLNSGLSLWSIQSRVLLLQTKAGYDAQRSYADSVRVSDESIGIAGLIAHFASWRNEPATTFSKYQQNIEGLIGKGSMPEGIGAHLNFHAYHPTTGNESYISRVVTFSITGCLIDCYNAVRYGLVAAAGRSVAQGLSLIAGELATATADSFLNPIFAPSPPSPGDQLPAATEAFFKKDYSVAATLAAAILQKEPTNPGAFLLCALAVDSASLGGLGLPRTVHALVVAAHHIFKSGDGRGIYASELRKWAANLQGSPLAALINALTYVDSEEEDGLEAIRVAAMTSRCGNPIWLRWLANSPEHFSRHLAVARQNPWTEDISRYLTTLENGTAAEGLTESDEALVTRAALAIITEGGAALKALSSRLAAISQPYYTRIATAQLTHLLLRNGQLDKAVNLVADALAREPTWQYSLPVRAVGTALLENESRNRTMASAILLERYAQIYQPTADTDVVLELVDVMRSHAVKAPSRLLHSSSSSLLREFLRRVATEPVMERSGLFDSSEEVAEERLNVCEVLLSIDSQSAGVYQDEIKEITRRRLVARRLKEVERSKVFIDVERLRKDMLERLADSFARYKALRSSKAMPQLYTLSVQPDSPSGALLVIKFGGDEVTALLGSLVTQIRDNYVGSPDYGLDKYLSVRIRHGTFVSHLRSPLDDAKLITARELGGKGYRRNDYWPTQMFPFYDLLQQALADRLTTFSEAYDNLLEKTKGLLTISKDEEGVGLFRFAISASTISALERISAREDVSFAAFIDTVISLCDRLLESSLAKVRQLLEQDFKGEASNLLDKLSGDVEEMGGPNANALVNAIGQASVTLRVTADRVRDWFTRSASAITDPFTLDEAVEVARQISMRISPHFELEANMTSVDGTRFEGRLMFPLIDVLFIVMDNVIKHADLDNHPRASLKAWRVLSGTKVRCENALGPSVKASDVKRRFDAIKKAATTGEGTVAISKEGGTGLYKLARIVSNDIATRGEYDFGVSDDGVVFVEVTIPDELVVSK